MSFSLSRKTDYALVALARLAAFDHSEGQMLSAREIAEQYDLPAALLCNVMKDLQRADILCSRRGAGGGYHLCSEPNDISLLTIIEAVEGKVAIALCCEETESETDSDNTASNTSGGEPCVKCQLIKKGSPATTPIQRFNGMVREFLAGVSLADLIDSDAALPEHLQACGVEQ